MAVSCKTVYRLVSSGALAAVKIGGAIRIREDDLERYLEANVIRRPEKKLPQPQAARRQRRPAGGFRFFPPS